MKGGHFFNAGLVREALTARDDARYPVSQISRPGENDRPGSFFTFAAMIAELNDRPRLHIAAGAPSHHEFQTYVFDGDSSRAALIEQQYDSASTGRQI